MTKLTFRVIDTGLREGRANIAFDQALIDAHKAGEVPDTIRFLRFPPTALIGRHQALSQEVQLDHCYDNDIGVVRRITGGGAIYFDEGQLGWELAFNRKTLGISSLADLTKAICERPPWGLAIWASTRNSGRATISKWTAAKYAAPAAFSTAIRCSTKARC